MPKARRRRPARPESTPDLPRAEAAVRELLEALGRPLEADSNLAETPARVARAWAETLLSGYRTTPEEALGGLHPSPGGAAVVMTNINFLSMCPHHLLPFTGQAHVAFLPSGRVPGFGRIAHLIDALAHRLVLQEELTSTIVSALADHGRAKAVVCMLDATHSCVAVTDPARQGARFRTIAHRGGAADVRRLTAELHGRLGACATPP